MKNLFQNHSSVKKLIRKLLKIKKRLNKTQKMR